jgi:hypothetical protein
LACLLAHISPVMDITYILHQHPKHTAMVLGCSAEDAENVIRYYRLIVSAVEREDVKVYESAIFPNGMLRGFAFYREEIEVWLEQQGISLPEGLQEARQKISHLAELRTTGKQWVDLVNTTDLRRYQANSSPAALKKNQGYYQQKLVGIGLIAYLLLDLPFEKYQGQKTEQTLYHEWLQQESAGAYPWMWMVYAALREAVLLEEIVPKKITPQEGWELYEVPLKAALLWCRAEGVMLDELMLAYIEKVKNDLPYPDDGLTARATRKQQTINIRKQIKEAVPEIYRELVKQRGSRSVTKTHIAHAIRQRDFASDMTIKNILRLFSRADYIPS